MKLTLSFPWRLSINILLISFFAISLITTATFYVTNRLMEEQLISDMKANLVLKSESFQSQIKNIELNVRLLAKNKAVQGIIRSNNNYEYDKETNNSSNFWRDQLAQLFITIMEQHPSYYSIRLIGKQDDGLEIVRVDSIQKKIQQITREELQKKATRDYFNHTIALQPGEVYISKINLNREHGRIVMPPQQTIRLSTPIFDQNNQPFGILIINADFSYLISALAKTETNYQYYMTNLSGHYLYHSDKDKQFAFEFGDNSSIASDFAIQEEYRKLNYSYVPNKIEINEKQQLILQRIDLGTYAPKQRTAIIGLINNQSIWQDTSTEVYRNIYFAIFIIVILIASFSFYMSSRLSKPIINLTEISRRIARGEQNVDINVESKDEVGELANSIKLMVEHLEQSQLELQKFAHSLEEKVIERTKTIQNKNSAIEASLTGIVIVAKDGVISYCNAAFIKIFTFPSDRIAINSNLVDLWDEKEQGIKFLQDLAEKNHLRGEISAITFAQKSLSVELSAATTMNFDGEIEFVVSFSDISERKQSELNLKKLSKAIEHSASVVFITDTRSEIEYVNARFLEVTGYHQQEVIGQTAAILRSGQNPEELYEDLWKTITTGENWHGEILNRKKNGEFWWSLQSISQIRDDSGQITHYISVCEDVTSIKNSHKKIEQMAYYDALTGLPNRRLFKDRLEQALITTSRKHYKLALLYLDLDGFKMINDTLGHDAGDRLLKQVAYRLKQAVHAEDVVARLGGDEFSIILKEIRDSETTGHVAEKILDTIQQPMEINGHRIIASTSIGITICPDDGDTIGILLKNADMAMYKAKDKGKNNWQFYTDEMNQSAVSRLSIEQDLRIALESNQFRLHYQPIMNLKTGKIQTIEALIRWQHPNNGLLSPGVFIEIAEDTGLIIEMGRWVLKETRELIQILREQGIDDINIAVNLSPRQFQDHKLQDLIVNLAYEDSLNWLEIEITEGLLIHDIKLSIKKLCEFKEKGAQIVLDDFGTGYSSLGYLQQLPLDKLKIDRSFIAGIDHNEADKRLTQAIITMAKELGLQIVAEGIETLQQQEFVNQYDCHFAQGYFYYKPIDQDNILPLLIQTNLEQSKLALTITKEEIMS